MERPQKVHQIDAAIALARSSRKVHEAGATEYHFGLARNKMLYATPEWWAEHETSMLSTVVVNLVLEAKRWDDNHERGELASIF